MSVDIQAPGPEMIIFKGIFDFDELYKTMHDWFNFRGYTFHEVKFKKKSKDTGYEIELIWCPWRKVTDFLKYRFNVHVLIFNVEKIEVIKNNQKKELMKGRMFMEVKAFLEADYSDRFEGSKLKKGIRQFIISYVLKRKIDTMWGDKLEFKQYEFLNVVKECLDMQIKGNEHADVW